MTLISVPPWDDDDVRLSLLAEVREAVGAHLLVGAHARDILCRDVADLRRSMPRTEDLDIAIAIDARGEDYDSRVAALDGSRYSSAMRFALPSMPGVPVDVIPCGPGVVDPENIPLDGDRTLDATGMAEAMACRIRVKVHADLTVSIPPLHAAIALKLIAFGLRVEIPEFKDARDLDMLLDVATVAGGLVDHDMWANAESIPSDFEHDPVRAGCWMAGVRIRADFPEVVERIDRACADPRLPGLMIDRTSYRAGAADVRERRAHLADLRRGLRETDVALTSWPPLG